MRLWALEPVGDWRGESPIRDILSLLEGNPFAPFSESDFNLEDTWHPYDQNHVWQELQASSEPTVMLRTTHPYSLWAMICIGPNDNHISMEIDDAYLITVDSQLLKKFAWQVAQAFPDFRGACVEMEAARMNDFYWQHHLAHLPSSPLGSSLDWYHIVSPAGLAARPAFTREVLLATPCYQVQELPNGWITLQLYDEPLHYASPQAEQTIITATQYLLAHQHYHTKYTP